MTVDMSWRARLRTLAGRQDARAELLAALAAMEDGQPTQIAEVAIEDPPLEEQPAFDGERDHFVRNWVWDTLDEIGDSLTPLPRLPEPSPNLAVDVAAMVDGMVNDVPPLPELPPVVWRCGKPCTTLGQLCQRDEAHEGACSQRDRRRNGSPQEAVTHPLLTELAMLATAEAWPFLPRPKATKNA